MRRAFLLHGIAYGIALGAFAVILEWARYKYWVRTNSGELTLFFIAAAFTLLGVWVGRRLTQRIEPRPFERNDAAIATLGVTDREYEVLALLASGCANKEIARRLSVSPNTVKTHGSKLYEKLEVQRRTQAVQKARQLALIP